MSRGFPKRLLLLGFLVLVGACTGHTEELNGADSQSESSDLDLDIPEGLPIPTPVDPDAALRCSQYGYPCSWDDVTESAKEHVEEVWSALDKLVNAEDSPKVGIERGLAYLADLPDVLEVGADPSFFTAISFRLEGAPPAVVHTITSGMAGEAEPYEGPPISVNPPEQSESSRSRVLLASFGRSPVSVLADFRPAGGPLEQKKALVLDPYATKATDCGGGIPDSQCFKEIGKNRAEGTLVAAILGSHPQIEVTYLPGNQASLESMGDVSSYDLVHIASHGGLVCTYIGPDGFSKVCDSTVQVAHPGEPGVSSEWFRQNIGSDAILYVSACTSGAGRYAGAIGDPQRPGVVEVGSFVGWGDYADVGEAQRVATHFWRMMVEEGVSFDVAYRDIVAREMNKHELQNLHVPEWEEIVEDLEHVEEVSFRVWSAHLIAKGDNLRARDVIETTFGSASSAVGGGTLLEVEGITSDGVSEKIPEVSFTVEGVENGTEGFTKIEMYLNGRNLEKEITVSDGKPVPGSGGSGFQDWEVTVENLDIGLDLTPEQVDPADPVAFEWEARVFVDKVEYSADRVGPIFFNASAGECQVSLDWSGPWSGSMDIESPAILLLLTDDNRLVELSYWEELTDRAFDFHPFQGGVSGYSEDDPENWLVQMDQPGVYTAPVRRSGDDLSTMRLGIWKDGVGFEDFGDVVLSTDQISVTIDRVERRGDTAFTSHGTFEARVFEYIFHFDGSPPDRNPVGAVVGEFIVDSAACKGRGAG